MSRCVSCDYTRDDAVASEFYGGITHRHNSKRVLYDKKADKFYCEECYDVLRENYLDLTEYTQAVTYKLI